jgi:hypothetical protein
MQCGRWVRPVIVLLAAIVFSAGAHAEGRVALVIGNSAYERLPVLDSPRNDAMAVAAKLQRLGYTVITGIDLDRAATEAKLQQFWQASENADIALFYYAGHGLQVSGRDYLVPIDATLTDAKNLDDAAFDLMGAVSPLEYGPDIGLVIFDASRDNPLPPSVEPSTGDSRSPASPPGGPMVIAFATAPGRAAATPTAPSRPRCCNTWIRRASGSKTCWDGYAATSCVRPPADRYPGTALRSATMSSLPVLRRADIARGRSHIDGCEAPNFIDNPRNRV